MKDASTHSPTFDVVDDVVQLGTMATEIISLGSDKKADITIIPDDEAELRNKNGNDLSRL